MPREGSGATTIGARALAVVSAVFWGYLFFGLIDLAVPLDETPGFYASYLLETGWGVLYTFLVAAAFVSLAVRPRLAMPLAQLAVVAACLVLTALAAGSWVQLLPGVALAATCFVLLRLTNSRPRWPAARARVDPIVGAVALAAVVPAAIFGLDMIMGYREGRPPLDDETWGIDHWPTQGALGLSVAAVAVAVAAGVRARWTGTAVSAGCVAVAAGWFGYWSTVYPRHAGSAGEAWGTALIGWAFVFVGVVAWRLATRRGDSRPAR
jgi:hypothetical protein